MMKRPDNLATRLPEPLSFKAVLDALAIAAGLRERRVRLPEQDEHVLLAWADKRYGF